MGTNHVVIHVICGGNDVLLVSRGQRRLQNASLCFEMAFLPSHHNLTLHQVRQVYKRFLVLLCPVKFSSRMAVKLQSSVPSLVIHQLLTKLFYN